MRARQRAEHAERIGELLAGNAMALGLGADHRQHGGEDRAGEHHQPREVEPNQEDRDRRKGAVDQRVGRHLAEINREAALCDLEAQARERAAEQRMAPLDAARGDHAVEQRQGHARQHERHHADHRVGDQPEVERPERAAQRKVGHREARADQHRSERDHRPVDVDVLQDGAPALHPEDAVERVVDREHQHHGSHHEPGDADGGEARRVLREGVDLVDDGLDRGRVGQHVLEHEKLQRPDPLVEYRECRGDGERHRE